MLNRTHGTRHFPDLVRATCSWLAICVLTGTAGGCSGTQSHPVVTASARLVTEGKDYRMPLTTPVIGTTEAVCGIPQDLAKNCDRRDTIYSPKDDLVIRDHTSTDEKLRYFEEICSHAEDLCAQGEALSIRDLTDRVSAVSALLQLKGADPTETHVREAADLIFEYQQRVETLPLYRDHQVCILAGTGHRRGIAYDFMPTATLRRIRAQADEVRVFRAPNHEHGAGTTVANWLDCIRSSRLPLTAVVDSHGNGGACYLNDHGNTALTAEHLVDAIYDNYTASHEAERRRGIPYLLLIDCCEAGLFRDRVIAEYRNVFRGHGTVPELLIIDSSRAGQAATWTQDSHDADRPSDEFWREMVTSQAPNSMSYPSEVGLSMRLANLHMKSNPTATIITRHKTILQLW